MHLVSSDFTFGLPAFFGEGALLLTTKNPGRGSEEPHPPTTSMKAFLALTLCLAVALEPVSCQRVQRKLQPWLQGVIAVTVFLVLTVIALVINKIWCQDKDESLEDGNKNMRGNKEDQIISNGTEGNYFATAADFRCEEGHHVYENNVELECGNTTECHVENHVEVLTTCM